MTGFAGWLLPFSRFQHALSITLGATLLFVACTGIGNIRIAFLSKPLIALSAFTKKTFAVLLHTKTFLSTFLLGMLNGLLPCGLTFIALTYCLTLSDPLGGFKYMILFGIGTLPAMLGATVLLKYVVDKFNFSLRRITTIMLFISGCILIARVFFVHGAHAPAEEQHLVDIIICGGKQATPMK
jgi:sulfite exporter TauE/SafE